MSLKPPGSHAYSPPWTDEHYALELRRGGAAPEPTPCEGIACQGRAVCIVNGKMLCETCKGAKQEGPRTKE